MDPNLNDTYQEDSASAMMENLNSNNDNLEPDILMTVKQEDLDDDAVLEQGDKKFFDLTPVEFSMQESFSHYDANIQLESNEEPYHVENSDERSVRVEKKAPSKWSEETTLKFVKEYRHLECLWDVKSPSYRNKTARDAAYQCLAECANLPGFTVQEAKNKIKNLRSTYSQELKKVRQSKKSGSDDIYQPSLIWYKEIDTFLGPIIASRDNLTPMEVPEEPLPDNEDTLEGNSQSFSPTQYLVTPPADLTEGDRKGTKRYIPHQQVQTTQHCKKKKKVMHDHLMASSQLSKNDDEFDAFGKSVAAQLKKFTLAGALKTQVKIQSLLAQERINDALESDTLLPNDTNAPLTPTSHHSQASCCSCAHDISQPIYNTNEVLDDINSADILSQAVNSILPA